MKPISRVCREEFAQKFDEIRAKRLPVVIEGLFSSPNLAQVNRFDTLMACLGEEVVGLSSNYVSGFPENIKRYYRGEALQRKTRKRVPLNQYLKTANEDPKKDLLCNESLTPAFLLEGLSLQEIGVDEISRDYKIPFEGYVPKTAYSFFFLAAAGSCSDMHTDWDGRDVIVNQVCGKKRVAIIPSRSSYKLQPLFVLSSVSLRHMSDDERAKFLEYTGGYDVTLEPGESIYIPPFAWHQMDYVDHAASINFRFGGIASPKLSHIMSFLHVDAYTQNVMDELLRMSDEGSARADILADRIISCYSQSYKSSRAKYRAIKQTVFEIYCELHEVSAQAARYSWLSNHDLCADVLAKAYELPDGTLTKRRRFVWRLNEKVRNFIRMHAFKVASRV